jgi:acyl-CoA thioesterase-1
MVGMRERLWTVTLLALSVLTAGGCGGADPSGADGVRPPVPSAAIEDSRPDAPGIVLLGDSLTAGLGLAPEDSYPALLQKRLSALGYPHRIVNAGVSGDTSAGGLRRLEWSIDDRTEVLVVALGGNDGLRGLPLEQLRANLAAIIDQARQQNIRVILAGMEAPPNFGTEYTTGFRQVYADLAGEYDVPLIPFLLDGVGGVPALNQPDGIHPNAEGAAVLAETVWQALAPLLARPAGTP